MHEVLFLGKTTFNAQIQKDSNRNRKHSCRKKSGQMADPLGTLNTMFGEGRGAVPLLGHIDRSGLGNMLRW